MRPSFAFVRCWVSSTDFESESTLLSTSPTRCLTIFFVAHALVAPSAIAEIAIAVTNLFIAVSFQDICTVLRVFRGLTAGARTRGIAPAGAHRQIPIPGLHVHRPPARGGRGRRVETRHVLMAQLVDDLARRQALVRGR